MEELEKKIRSLKLLKYSLEDQARMFPSNTKLRKISRSKFESLKLARDEHLKPLQDEILAIDEKIEALKSQIKLQNSEPLEKTSFNLNNVDSEFVEILEQAGFNTDFLLEKAKQGDNLARQILQCWECIPEGRGYDGYSMSKNALAAYSNNQKPISKFNKSDILAFNELFEVKTTLKNLKEFLKLFGGAGYHHTSKFYNATAFYSLAIALKNCKKVDFEKFFTNKSNFCKSKQK